MKNKKAQLTWNTLIPWLIALAVLIIASIIIFGYSNKSNVLIDYLKAMLNLGN